MFESLLKLAADFKVTIDTLLGGLGITAPLVWGILETLWQSYLGLAGGALLTIRLILAYREWRQKNVKDNGE